MKPKVVLPPPGQFEKLMNLAEEDGDVISTFQINSGLDGARNFYGAIRHVQNDDRGQS